MPIIVSPPSPTAKLEYAPNYGGWAGQETMLTTTPPEILKVAVLGDANTGKSNLITTYQDNCFTGEYIPTIEDMYCKTLTVIRSDGSQSTIRLDILDCGGSEEHDRILPLLLEARGPIDVFILCFRLGDSESFGSITTRWKGIIDHCGEDAPIVLVGLMADQASEEEKEDYSEIVRILGASAYLECSSHDNWGLDEVFEKAVGLGLTKRAGRS